MIVGTMVPIPKCKYKELENSDNYQPIALISSIIRKTLDRVIILKEQKTINSSELQFGFNVGFSTTKCTYVLLETVSHYNYHDSNVYSVLVDATKAFDRLHYCKLFNELIKMTFFTTVIKLLLYMYIN